MEKTTADINDLVSRESVELLSQTRLLEAELVHRSRQLQKFESIKHRLVAEGEDERTAFNRLWETRKGLLEQLKERRDDLKTPREVDPDQITLPGTVTADFGAPQMVMTPGLDFIFGTRGCVRVSRASEGVNVTPGVSGTHGSIQTYARNADSEIRFHGIVEKDAGLGGEHVWLRNWRYTAVFPCMRSAGTLAYKFRVRVQANLFAETGGSVMAFVSVGEEADAVQAGLDAIQVDPSIGGWPLNEDLDDPVPYTYNGHYGYIAGETTVEHSFNVAAGNTPALAIIVGVIVILDWGEVRLAFGGFGPSWTYIDDAGDPATRGQICYSYTPILIAQP